jgi:hypothetical protein
MSGRAGDAEIWAEEVGKPIEHDPINAEKIIKKAVSAEAAFFHHLKN